MITQNLIDLISKGKAQYKTWCTGATASSRIPVPKNNYIVITDFHYSHFCDRDPLVTNPKFFIAMMYANCVHGLLFRSFGNDFFYTVRSGFNIYNAGVDENYILQSQPDTHFNTYQVHKTDCHIDIWRFPDYSNWGLSTSKLDDKTSEYAGPTGYGTQNNTPNQNVVREIFFDAPTGQQYVPYGENQGLPLNTDWREQFRPDISNLSALFPPDINNIDAHYTYPIINIGYVLVNHPFETENR